MLDTVLSLFVKEFGDLVLMEEVASLYQTTFVKTIIYCSFIGASANVLFALWRGHFPSYALRFLMAWAACLPINGQPVGYRLVNGISSAFAYQMEKTKHAILTRVGDRAALPPNFVYNAILRAGTAEISDPTISNNVRNLIEYCVPETTIAPGGDEDKRRPFTPVDLFTGQMQTDSSGRVSFSYDFPLSLLTVRTFDLGEDTINCMGLLRDTRTLLARHISGKGITNMPQSLLVGTNNGESEASGVTPTTIRDPAASVTGGYVRQYALNLAHAASIQKEVLRQYFNLQKGSSPWTTKLMAATGTLDPSVEIEAKQYGAKDIPTSIMFEAKGIWSAFSRYFGLDGAIDNGSILADVNEKMQNMPLFIANVQMAAKILLPIACLTLFFTSKFFLFWSYIWFISLITPTLIHLSRSVANSMHLNQLRIVEVARGLQTVSETDVGYLYRGINFSAANEAVADASKLMNNLLNFEMYAWGTIFLILPAGIWMHQNRKNMMASVAEGFMSTAGRIGVFKVAEKFVGAFGGAGAAAAVTMNAMDSKPSEQGGGGFGQMPHAASGVTFAGKKANDLTGPASQNPNGPSMDEPRLT